MDEASPPKADFHLRRVDVDVHLLGRHLQKNQRDGEHSGGKDVAIRLMNRMQQQAVPHQTAVDENEDLFSIQALHFGPGDESGKANDAGFGIVLLRCVPAYIFANRVHRQSSLHPGNLNQLLQNLPAEKLEDPFATFAHTGHVHQGAAARL